MIARREYECIRHETTKLSPMLRETRIEEDFLENIDGMVSPTKGCHGILQSLQSGRDFLTVNA
jgi:hypothetical protein